MIKRKYLMYKMEQPVSYKRGPKVKLTDEQRRERQKEHSKKYYDTHKEYFVKYREELRQRNQTNNQNGSNTTV